MTMNDPAASHAGATVPGEFVDGAKGMAQPGDQEFGFLADDTRAIACAMALRWTWITQTQLLNLLRAAGSRSAQSAKAFTGEQIKGAWARLKQVGLLQELTHRPGYVRLTDPLRTEQGFLQIERRVEQALHDAEAEGSRKAFDFRHQPGEQIVAAREHHHFFGHGATPRGGG